MLTVGHSFLPLIRNPVKQLFIQNGAEFMVGFVSLIGCMSVQLRIAADKFVVQYRKKNKR